MNDNPRLWLLIAYIGLAIALLLLIILWVKI